MENNKLIVEFMGNPTIFNPIHDATLYQVKEQDNMTYHIDELQYHLSWDWLMPVANEIIKSRDEQNADWDLTDLKYALQTTNIELVYKAVVKFIKDYNKNN